MSRIFQGILRTPRRSIPDGKALVLLWKHECERVFCDKLTSYEDKSLCNAEIHKYIDELLDTVNPNKDDAVSISSKSDTSTSLSFSTGRSNQSPINSTKHKKDTNLKKATSQAILSASTLASIDGPMNITTPGILAVYQYLLFHDNLSSLTINTVLSSL